MTTLKISGTLLASIIDEARVNKCRVTRGNQDQVLKSK